MNKSTHLLPNEDGSHTAIIGPSGEARSMLTDLTPDEAAQMVAWSEQQPRSPGGSIDLMGWPGWQAVMERRFKGRFGVDLKQPGT